ncbi:phosphatase PAP2 family protein [Marichromatium bheemlicum]|uniref:undecaprenyl-diphosphate phosphatase n=1 Tax=Marichromatium bheemlicum TaxID=365339 RepID=A0ABX1IAU1_9GAMM|nr:phosphatase PAP2 family protein [Marichromatium bheemlicum]NKN33986.1 phosphatase PAP2 family protein [Marichromatium bheemlicum]
MQMWLQHLNDLETILCRACSRPSRRQWIQRSFALISRLGDGLFWYSLIALLPLTHGLYGLQTSLHMLLTGGVALALYKSLKGVTRRERPCNHATDIVALVPPLDRYSFPSGHTLHAVVFTMVAIHYFPQLAWILVPFTLLVAGSRVILGLHYPSDVLVATAIGLLLADTSLALLG